MKGKFYLITTYNDKSRVSLHEGIHALGYECEAYDYRDLHQRLVANQPLLETRPGKADVLLARQAYVANKPLENYMLVLHQLMDDFTYGYVFDRRLYLGSHYMMYADKLFQSWLFRQLEIPQPRFFFPQETEIPSFPLVAKRRISSRSKAVYLIRNQADWTKHSERDNRYEFLYQEFIPIEHDWRILVLGGEVLGVIERRIVRHADGRLGVKIEGGRVVSNVDPTILSQARKIAAAVGTDFSGIDVGITAKGKYVFLEYNTSPQFVGFEKLTGISVTEKLVRFSLSQRLR